MTPGTCFRTVRLPRLPPGSCRAATLIELLVAIAVISLLVAVMAPSLRGARDQTHRVVCQANQRQILLAMQFYAGDHQDRWFTFNHRFDFETGQYTGVTYHEGEPVRWEQIVDGNSCVALAMRPGSYRPASGGRPATAEPSGYVSDWGVLVCPATANRVDRPEHLNDIVADRRKRCDDSRQAGHSYSYLNGFEAGEFLATTRPNLGDAGQYDRYPNDGLPDCLKSPARVASQTSRIILLADGDNRVAGADESVDVTNCPDHESDNHGPGGWNVGFADGHVDWLDPAETFWALYASGMTGRWTPGWSHPNTE